MPLIKVWNHDRSARKIVKVTDLKGLLDVGVQKLGYNAEELKACLEIDGTDIEDEDIFQELFHEKEVHEVIMILPKSFKWAPACSQQDISSVTTSPNILEHAYSILISKN